MTEGEWLICKNPQDMLVLLRRKASNRKLRLFACACCRRVWHLLTDEPGRRAVEVTERHADGIAPRQELAAAFLEARQGTVARACARGYAGAAAREVARMAGWSIGWFTPTSISGRVATWDAEREALKSNEEAAQAELLRDIFGNPFRPVATDPAWQAATVLALAQAAYDEREMPAGTLDVARLAVLADALEEVGCTGPAILGHLRGPGPHVRGCWVIDLLLGKS